MENNPLTYKNTHTHFLFSHTLTILKYSNSVIEKENYKIDTFLSTLDSSHSDRVVVNGSNSENEEDFQKKNIECDVNVC